MSAHDLFAVRSVLFLHREIERGLDGKIKSHDIDKTHVILLRRHRRSSSARSQMPVVLVIRNRTFRIRRRSRVVVYVLPSSSYPYVADEYPSYAPCATAQKASMNASTHLFMIIPHLLSHRLRRIPFLRQTAMFLFYAMRRVAAIESDTAKNTMSAPARRNATKCSSQRS